MKIFLRYICFCALLLVLLSFIHSYTSDADYALIEKEVATEDSLAMRDLEYFKQEHGKDRKAMLFYRFMRTHVFLHKGKEVSLDSVERWTAEAKETGDSLLYAKSLETLSAYHAARGELAQALSAQQRACGVTSHANAAFALHIRYVIALLAVVLCIGIALCLTFLHLYKREKTGKQHAERRLEQAKGQLATTSKKCRSIPPLYATNETSIRVGTRFHRFCLIDGYERKDGGRDECIPKTADFACHLCDCFL